jgi:DNA-binding transcriptional ArsR family regulator
MIELRFLTVRGFYVINRLHVTDTSKNGRVSRHRRSTRRAILDRLRAGPANAGTLASDFQSAGRPFQAFKSLGEARLVVDTRIGRERVYAVNPVRCKSVAGWLEGYRAFWLASLTKLKRNLETK